MGSLSYNKGVSKLCYFLEALGKSLLFFCVVCKIKFFVVVSGGQGNCLLAASVLRDILLASRSRCIPWFVASLQNWQWR